MSWTLRTLLSAADVPAALRGDAAVAGISYDPAAVRTGDVFCCIRGARADGHDFAAGVAAAGAAALLVERRVPVDVPQAVVASVREAMGPLAAAFHGHPSGAMRVVGITGTNGKTTVTYLLESIAEAAGWQAGVIGTVRYRVGSATHVASRTTPEAPDLQRLLAQMREASTDLVAMEVASHALSYRRVDGTRFACVAFTNLSQDHLDLHGDMEAYFEAKARLFDRRFAPAAVINTGDASGARLAARCEGLEVITYAGPDADVRCTSAELGPGGILADVTTRSGRMRVQSSLVGPYNLENLLCAIAVASSLDIPGEAIAAGVAEVSVPGRLEVIDEGQPFLALVDYAHTPDALARVLSAARELASGRVIVVFGCGGDRDRSKRPVMGEVATTMADLAFVTSDNPRSEEPGAIIAEIVAGAERGAGEHRVVTDRRQALGEALAEAGSGDVVVVAGKGHEQGQVFADRTVPFDDRVVVRELIKELRCRA